MEYACKHIEAVFKAVKKIGWSRDGIEVEVVRRYMRQKQNGRNEKTVEVGGVCEETPAKVTA